MNATEVFQQHGLPVKDEQKIMLELAGFDADKLWELTEQFTGDAAIGVQGSEEIQANTLRFALVNAFTANADSITQSDIDLAQQRALSLGNDVASLVANHKPKPKADPEPQSDVQSEPVKRTHRSSSREIIKSLVKASPNAKRDDILKQAFDKGIDVSRATANMYFYDVRKELDLKPNGKRGRKPTNTQDDVKALVLKNWDNERSTIIKIIVDEMGYKENTAKVYYQNAQKALREEGLVEG